MNVQIYERTGTELIPFHGLSIKDNAIMDSSLKNTPHIFDAFINGERTCIIGLIPPTLLSDRAYVWLHTTPSADQHKFLVIRYSQRLMEKILDQWPTVTGHCIVNDSRAIRWMKWLGANFGQLDGNKVPFTIRRK